MRTFILLLLITLSSQIFAQETAPIGPPWTAMCESMDKPYFALAVPEAGCRQQFLGVYNSTEDLDQIHSWMKEHRSCFKEWAHYSWMGAFYNDLKMAELSWLHQLYFADLRLQDDTICSDRSCYAESVRSLVESGLDGSISPEAVQYTNQFLDIVEQNTAFDDEMKKAFDSVTPLCLYHMNTQCIRAMKQALTWMYPRSYKLNNTPPESITFSMLGFYREVFRDSQTQKFASQWALHLIDIIENKSYADGELESLYEMGLRFFEGDQDRFWKFMIVYSTRGAAWITGYKLAHEDNKPLFAAMMVISAAMPVLDAYDGVFGRGWSYPSVIDTTCYQPKPYHYWMSAGFAYLLGKEGYTKTTSRLVSRLLGAGYEFASTTMGRDPDEVFFLPTYHPNVNRMRREIAHHYLGAMFGSSLEPSNQPSFDETLARIMNKSKPLPDISDAQMAEDIKDPLRRWKYWSDLIGYYFQ
jgi:hypothetical protein